MPKIVSPPIPKQVTCGACSATIEYLPEEVTYTDGGAGFVKCPREKCPGIGYVRTN